ncbi:MAG: Gfo/Idh/MocA family oxidoreductase [bacterium]|nr:Gfo/Idh/MocA family oxidoreductase [bacterium]
MKTYRAAVIGLGRMGSTFDDEITQGGSIFLPYCHAPAYAAAPRVDLVAGADPHEEQRVLFGKRWELDSEHLYADHREMLEREKPDFVSVCTTARVRPQIVLDAVEAGVKAIWAEKPLAFTLVEAGAMVGMCREAGVVLAVNCARRWNPFFMTMKRLIEEGEIGKVLQVTGYGQCGLSHNGSHLIDILRYMAGGKVEWVFGEMESDEAAEGERDLMGNGYLAMDNGVRVYLRGMPCGAANWEIDVIGEKGRLRSTAGGQGAEFYRMTAGGPKGRSVPAQVPFPWPAQIQGTGLTIVEDIISAVENGHAPRCSGEDGLEALEVAVALRESHRRGGKRVYLPLEDRSLGIQSLETYGDDVPARVRRERG